jgi:hypothetical protein
VISRTVAPVLLFVTAHALAAQSVSDTTPSALYAAPGAVLDRAQFAFARAIPPGEGLTAIRLDAAALAHSRIDDLRIVDERGRQVPYVLVRLGVPTVVPLPTPAPSTADAAVLRRVSGEQMGTAYRIALPYAGLPDAVLRLVTSARVFQRDVVVVSRPTPRDATRGERAGTAIARERWQHENPDSAAPPLELSLGRRLSSDSLAILVNDGDNQRLPVTSAALLLPTYRLRFFRQPGASLTLRYGRRDLVAPRYDLALLAPRLTGVEATEVELGRELASANRDAPTGRLLFWAVLGVAMVALLVLISRLLRGPPAEDR